MLGAALFTLAGCGGSSRPAKPASTGASRSSSTPSSASSIVTATATASASARTVSASAGGLTATMLGSSHTPRVGGWPVRFTATRSGRPASATVTYEFLLGAQVVAHRSHYHFTGSFSDELQWPADAVGYPLMLRAVIASGLSVINLDYPVQVSR